MHFLSYFSIIYDKLFNNKSTSSIRIFKIINNKLIYFQEEKNKNECCPGRQTPHRKERHDIK
jgi:hypothetical protein